MRNCLFILSLFLLAPTLSSAQGTDWEEHTQDFSLIRQRSAALANISFCKGFEGYFRELGNLLDSEDNDKLPTCASYTREAFELGASAGDVFEAYAKSVYPTRWGNRWAKRLRRGIENDETENISEVWLEVWDMLAELEEIYSDPT